MARYRGCVGPSQLASRPPFVDFFCSYIFSFQNNDPPKFIAHYDVVKVLKQLKKEIGVFCLRRINSIKGEIIINYQKIIK